ncbi:MAG: SusC/RagA family TonB-linked outer membrane protein [Bacteroidota bacterium]
MKKYLLLTVILVLMCSVGALAQISISGRITDAGDGSGLPGVNVVEKGTTNGTVTDFDGNYTLSVSDGASIIFSFVGYVTQEIAVGGQSIIDVSLSTDVTQLSEVVVVGYGTQEKKEITSAVVSLDSKDFNQGAINDASQLLQGKVPGLSIYNKGGDPNGTPTIRLRGISTVGANTEPLVVIDGVIGASLDNVDPNDIETINVLKDGSAAAIYGSRGSSGVILVTTKQGTAGKVTVNYNGQLALSTVQNELDILSADEFVAFGSNDLGGSTDWYDEVTRTGVTHIHNVAVSGGSETTSYRVSTNFRNVEGILEESGFDQINARANLSHRALNNKLKMDFNFSLTNRESDFSFNEALRYAVFYNPTAPVFGAESNIGTAADYEQFGGYFQSPGLFDSFNPKAIIDQNTNTGDRKILNFNARAEYSIIDQLSVTVNYGQQYTTSVLGEYYSVNSFFRGINRNGLARRTTQDQKFTLFESFATYTNSFDKIDLTFSGGYSFQENETESFLVETGDFPNDLLGFNALENSGDLNTDGLITLRSDASPEERIIAFFGRVNLTFDNAIFFNASLRREGSTKLGEDNQWGTFPAVGLGVDMTQYLDLPLSTLKVRAGYGVTGSLPRENGLSKQGIAFNRDGGTENFVLVRAANPDLKWEEKAEINVGIDFGTDRLTGALDVYTRTIDDFILERNVDPAVFQVDRRFENAGELKTNGIELSLNYDVVNNPTLSYNTGVVLSSYKTTLEEFIIDEQMQANLGAPGQNSTNIIRVKVGDDIGQIWGPRFSGQVDERGIPIMVDLNGDGQVISAQDAALSPDGDFEELGNGIPDLEIGWTNQLTYKNWDLNAFFRGAFGHSLVNTFRAFYEPRIPGQAGYNIINSDLARDDITSARFSSYYVEKANFFKLDNITIGYNFNMADSKVFSKVRAYFNVLNAFVITDYTGLDPEPVLQDFGPVDNGGRFEEDNGDPITPDVLSPGIDRRNNYFTSRTFTLGLNVTF